jgi:hypothetical protein
MTFILGPSATWCTLLIIVDRDLSLKYRALSSNKMQRESSQTSTHHDQAFATSEHVFEIFQSLVFVHAATHTTIGVTSYDIQPTFAGPANLHNTRDIDPVHVAPWMVESNPNPVNEYHSTTKG